MRIPRLALAASLFLSAAATRATQTDNFGIHAVPTPGKVVIDGQLKDWDLSGEILMCYDLESLLEKYSGQVAVMYDAENLYLSVRWKDDVPMGNIHEPKFQASKGWAGDALQLRLKTDVISHITAWYYDAGKEPGILFDYGIGIEKPFGGGKKQVFQTDGWKMQEGVEMAFLKNDDGKGYVQEIKIPWSLITKEKKPVAGESFFMGVELLWGETDWPAHRYADNLMEGSSSRQFFFTAHNIWGRITLEPKGGLKLPEPAYMTAFRKAAEGEKLEGPVEIHYELPRDARVTLAIDDTKGNRVRNLLPAAARKAGKNTERWDGLDDDGKPMPPGDYAVKIIYHDGINANYELSFANPGNPAWSTTDGRGAFYGDHTVPMAAAASGKFVAVANPMGEAGKHLIGLNLEPQRLWGLPNRTAFDGGWISLATDGKTLWVGNEGKEATIYRVNIADGKYAPWSRKVKQADGTEMDVLDLKVSEQPGLGTPGKPPANLRAIALASGEIAACLHRENLVKILDAATGDVKAELTVPQPQSITHDGKSWLVLSEGKILRMAADGKLSAFSAGSYPDAFGLAADAQGNVYLSVQGEDHNVKVFSPDGKLAREIGKRGGRPHHGAFIAEAMRKPAGIAIDSQNRLWVTEQTDNPKRTSVWDAATGELVKDLSGTTSYAGAGTINPFDPSMGLSDDTVYHIDWKTGTSRPVYSIGKSGNPDELFPPSVHNLTSRVIQRDGRTYVFTPGMGLASNEVQVTMFDGKDWRSVTHLGFVEPEVLKGPREKYKLPLFAAHSGEFYAWTDENADGAVQPEEVQFSKIEVDGKQVAPRGGTWGIKPDSEGTLTYTLREPGKPLSIPDVVMQLPITGVNKNGALQYDVSKPRLVRLEQPLVENSVQTMGGSPGRIYLNQSPLLALNANGKIIGKFPSKHVTVHGSHKAMAARPGYLIGPSSFLGVAELGNEKEGGAGEVFYLNGNLGENYLFTYDGLYIQTLFKDTRGVFDTPEKAVRGMPMDSTTAGGESFGGNFVRTKDGKFLVTLGGTEARVMELTGLEGIRRLSGKFSYSKEQYAAAQELAKTRAAETSKPKSYRIAKGSAEIDGKTADWPELLAKENKAIAIQESDRKRYGQVEMRYDAENLYVAWKVNAPRSAMKNSGQDFRLLFKTGDVVDLMIGPEKTKAGAEGNSRIVLAVMDEKPVAVLNQPKAPNAPKTESFEFASPWRSFVFDRVVQAAEVKVATGKVPGGFLVEAAIPWELLGIKPVSGLKLAGDVGVLFGNAGGTETIARHYWSNQSTNLVNDVPGEAELTPKLWGSFELE
jgi:hypothetical protein